MPACAHPARLLFTYKSVNGYCAAKVTDGSCTRTWFSNCFAARELFLLLRQRFEPLWLDTWPDNRWI